MTLRISGMSCGHCVRRVSKALAGVPGVDVREVEIGRAVLDAAEPQAVQAAIAALRQAGYDAEAVE
jgi:copper chaperone CopZ